MIVNDGTILDLEQPHIAIYNLDPWVGWNHHPLGVNSITDEGLPDATVGSVILRAEKVDECYMEK